MAEQSEIDAAIDQAKEFLKHAGLDANDISNQYVMLKTWRSGFDNDENIESLDLRNALDAAIAQIEPQLPQPEPTPETDDTRTDEEQ